MTFRCSPSVFHLIQTALVPNLHSQPAVNVVSKPHSSPNLPRIRPLSALGSGEGRSRPVIPVTDGSALLVYVDVR